MSLTPSFKAILEEGLSKEERNQVVDKLKALKGVGGANFNKAANAVYVSYDANPETKAAARMIAGVKAIGILH